MTVAECFVCWPSTLLTAGVAVPFLLASAATLETGCDIVAACASWRLKIGVAMIWNSRSTGRQGAREKNWKELC